MDYERFITQQIIDLRGDRVVPPWVSFRAQRGNLPLVHLCIGVLLTNNATTASSPPFVYLRTGDLLTSLAIVASSVPSGTRVEAVVVPRWNGRYI
jgi:hypothetical protein